MVFNVLYAQHLLKFLIDHAVPDVALFWYLIDTNYTHFVQMIAQRSAETREIMASIKTINRTDENEENIRAQETKNNAEIALHPVWQGLKDDYRTHCGIVSFSV